MARHERDELADALAGMASGQPVAPAPKSPAHREIAQVPADLNDAAEALSSATPQAVGEHASSQPHAASVPLRASATKTQSLSHVLAQNIEYKRTLIPILLTCGVLIPVLGALPWFLSDSMIGQMPTWAIACAFTTGAVLLALAIANMVQVKHQLDQMHASGPRTTR